MKRGIIKMVLLPAAVTFFMQSLYADIKPSPLFTDNAVLQRDSEVPVWGTAPAGESVTVDFAGQTRQTVADDQGRWEVRLAPMPANVKGNLTLRGKNVVVLTNLITGDVWLCSGQSNMEYPVNGVTNAAAEIAAANLPDIRQLKIPVNPSPEPQPDTYIKANWQPASPKTVSDFTAVGYFFAREIHKNLGVPIGIINSTLGGTRIEQWTPLEVLKTATAYPRILERRKGEMASWPARAKTFEAELKAWETNTAAARAAHQPEPQKPWSPGPPDAGRNMPAQLYNGMIHPLGHFPIKGVLWYQGESDADANVGVVETAGYTDLQSRMIQTWRKDWQLGNFPFYFVQLPNWIAAYDPSKTSWAFFREAQANILKVPNTGMAVTIDIGESGNVHPKNKQEVGRRLALIALAGTYGRPVVASGPVMSGCTVVGNTIRVDFDHADSGLRIRGDSPLSGFEIAVADGKFIPATAKLEQNAVVVSSPQIPQIQNPTWIRYAWVNDPSVNLFNGDGLPAAPFRTDTLKK